MNSNIFQEKGHVFKISGQEKLYYGTVTVVLADNLANSSLGGFKESSSVHIPCQQCLGHKDEIRKK